MAARATLPEERLLKKILVDIKATERVGVTAYRIAELGSNIQVLTDTINSKSPDERKRWRNGLQNLAKQVERFQQDCGVVVRAQSTQPPQPTPTLAGSPGQATPQVQQAPASLDLINSTIANISKRQPIATAKNIPLGVVKGAADVVAGVAFGGVVSAALQYAVPHAVPYMASVTGYAPLNSILRANFVATGAALLFSHPISLLRAAAGNIGFSDVYAKHAAPWRRFGITLGLSALAAAGWNYHNKSASAPNPNPTATSQQQQSTATPPVVAAPVVVTPPAAQVTYSDPIGDVLANALINNSTQNLSKPGFGVTVGSYAYIPLSQLLFKGDNIKGPVKGVIQEGSVARVDNVRGDWCGISLATMNGVVRGEEPCGVMILRPMNIQPNQINVFFPAPK